MSGVAATAKVPEKRPLSVVSKYDDSRDANQIHRNPNTYYQGI
jgi:hypothetical protein